MEAPLLRAALLVAAFFSLGAGRPYFSARSPHFIVSAPTAQLATEICQAAETYRRDLAIEWLGHELPEWQSPCPIRADVASHVGAGGATSFVFAGGMPTQWTMQIQGSRERVLDSVLPHEITHTVFATHFGRPLPRWADEGACTTVEHDSEKAKQDKFLIQFLTSEPPRSIPFNRMFLMKEYPPDILPLYSQGYSLARFLIHQGGKQKFVQYVGEGMRSNKPDSWTAATKKFYGFESLSNLQLTWVDWVRQGSPAIGPGAAPNAALASVQLAEDNSTRNIGNTQMASLTQQPRSRLPAGAKSSWQTVQEQNSRVFAQADQPEPPQPASFARPAITPIETPAGDVSSAARPVSEGWYAKRRDQAQATLPAASAAAATTSAPTRFDSAAESERAPAEQPNLLPNATPVEHHKPAAQAAANSPETAPASRRTIIQAEPLTPVGTPPGGSANERDLASPAAAPDRRVLLEWTRPSEQPYRSSSDVTGVALRETTSQLR